MLVKAIIHVDSEAAPFTGAVILTRDCICRCTGCHTNISQAISGFEMSVEEILEEVASNGENQGLTIGGVDWSDDLEEYLDLIEAALEINLEVMLYTHMLERYFRVSFPELVDLPIWVKFGRHDMGEETTSNVQHGVALGSTNQYVKFLGKGGKYEAKFFSSPTDCYYDD